MIQKANKLQNIIHLIPKINKNNYNINNLSKSIIFKNNQQFFKNYQEKQFNIEQAQNKSTYDIIQDNFKNYPLINSENTEQNNKNPGDLVQRSNYDDSKDFNFNNQNSNNSLENSYYQHEEYNQTHNHDNYTNIESQQYYQSESSHQYNTDTLQHNYKSQEEILKEQQLNKEYQEKIADVINKNPGLLDFFNKCNQGFWSSLVYVGSITMLLQGTPAPLLQEIIGRSMTISSLIGFYLLPKHISQHPDTGNPMIVPTAGRVLLYTIGNFGVAMCIAPKIAQLENIVILENIGISLLLWKLAQQMVLRLKKENSSFQSAICIGGMLALLSRGEGTLESLGLFFLANYVVNTQIVQDYFNANPDNLQISLLMVFIVQCYFLILTMPYFDQLNEEEQEEIKNSLEQTEEEQKQKLKEQQQEQEKSEIQNQQNKDESDNQNNNNKK